MSKKDTNLTAFFLFFPTKDPYQLYNKPLTENGKTQSHLKQGEKKIPKNPDHLTVQQEGKPRSSLLLPPLISPLLSVVNIYSYLIPIPLKPLFKNIRINNSINV